MCLVLFVVCIYCCVIIRTIDGDSIVGWGLWFGNRGAFM